MNYCQWLLFARHNAPDRLSQAGYRAIYKFGEVEVCLEWDFFCDDPFGFTIWRYRRVSGRPIEGMLLKWWEHNKRDWERSLLQRWRRWAQQKRATRIIKRFYYDYIVPRVWSPHTEGRGFLKLKRELEAINNT